MPETFWLFMIAIFYLTFYQLVLVKYIYIYMLL